MSNIRGRFKKDMNEAAAKYSASVWFDWRLYAYDITGSIAHARMLAKQGIISGEESEIIIKGLETIQEEIEEGTFKFRPELEDVHMNIEAGLIEKIGEIGGKLHTARSRNDQVALDVRLYARDAINKNISGLKEFQ
ncbi:lyase family protein, partial [Chloroflexota bacterium]